MSLLVMKANHRLEERLIRLSSSKEKMVIVTQVYVDDIIFGSTKDELAHGFSKLIQVEFEMSMIGELTHFLGLQIR